MRTVIAFDVSNDRKRYRVVKILKDYAVRVQKSVFEATDLDRSRFLRLRSRLERVIDPSTDSLRYYLLCEGCVARIEHHGTGPGLLDRPEIAIII